MNGRLCERLCSRHLFTASNAASLSVIPTEVEESRDVCGAQAWTPRIKPSFHWSTALARGSYHPGQRRGTIPRLRSGFWLTGMTGADMRPISPKLLRLNTRGQPLS